METGSMLKTVIERVAGHAGFEMIAKWRVRNLPYTHCLQTLFKHFGITSVIDIGANAGQFRDQMRFEVGFGGPIYSFEPDPVVSAALADRALTDPLWTVFPFALGAASGTMPFNLMQNSVYNSFRSPSSKQVGKYGFGNTVVKTLEVEVRTLDTMIDTFPDLAHTYFKIDTQGFDLEVLRGGCKVISKIPALQTEISFIEQYRDAPLLEESIEEFSKLGFAVADLFLVSQNDHHRAIEFDCVMVRDMQED